MSWVKFFDKIYVLNLAKRSDRMAQAKEQLDRYITIDSLYSVVKFRARTAGLIPFRVYKIKNQQKLKEYQYKTQMKDFTTQGMVRKLLLKFQAMEEVDEVIKKGYGVIEKSIR